MKNCVNQHLTSSKHISAGVSKNGENKITLLSTAITISNTSFGIRSVQSITDTGIPF